MFFGLFACLIYSKWYFIILLLIKSHVKQRIAHKTTQRQHTKKNKNIFYVFCPSIIHYVCNPGAVSSSIFTSLCKSLQCVTTICERRIKALFAEIGKSFTKRSPVLIRIIYNYSRYCKNVTYRVPAFFPWNNL